MTFPIQPVGGPPFSMVSSFYAAARDLAKHPEAQYDDAMQVSICRRYGIFLNQLTECEREYLFSLANRFMS